MGVGYSAKFGGRAGEVERETRGELLGKSAVDVFECNLKLVGFFVVSRVDFFLVGFFRLLGKGFSAFPALLLAGGAYIGSLFRCLSTLELTHTGSST